MIMETLALEINNHVSGTDTKTHSELPTLVGVLTYEAYSPLGKR